MKSDLFFSNFIIHIKKCQLDRALILFYLYFLFRNCTTFNFTNPAVLNSIYLAAISFHPHNVFFMHKT
jgi:hypothetical protein